MNSLLGPVSDLASGELWLITANFILSVLLGLWMVRYRKLYYFSRTEHDRIEETIDTLSEGIYRSTHDGRQIKANQALVRLNGYDTEAEMLSSVKNIAGEWYVDPNRRDDFREIMERDGVVHDFVSEIYRHKTRERIWITESARVVRDNRTGKALYYEGSVREITETVERLQLEAQFRNLMREVPGALFQFSVKPDRTVNLIYLSPGYERITGISAAEAMRDPMAFTRSMPAEDQELYAKSMGDAWGRQEAWDIEHRFVTRRGEHKWLRVSATPEFKGNEVIWHGYMSDITLRKNNELAIEKLAYFDTLTNLPNRRLFIDRMTTAIETCGRRGERGALLFVDLDNFKTLNDTQGHDVGDLYLEQVAARLQQCVSETDTVARIGGDEFVVLLESIGQDDAKGAQHAIGIANRINAAMRQRFELGAISYRASASIGVVVFDGNETKADEILKHADIAMYEAKSAGRDGLALFDPASLGRASERYKLLADLRDTIGRGGDELELYFQPLINSDGHAAAAEALIRWNHPQLGMVFPDNFIPLSEQFGLANTLGQIVLRKGIATLASWAQDARLSTLNLSINASVHCFTHEDFVPSLRRALEEHQVKGERLTIEITEHVMARDQGIVARRMRDLKALGVRLSLDDFGTGYSSLTYLKKLPFDEVKIDGSFVADIEKTDSDRALVRTILGMAQTLGLSAVAEHVETEAQAEFLRDHGCDYYQGWLYAKALPANEFEAYINATNPKLAALSVTGYRRPA